MGIPTAVFGESAIEVRPDSLYQQQNSSFLSVLSFLSSDGDKPTRHQTPKFISYDDILRAQYTDDDEHEPTRRVRVDYVLRHRHDLVPAFTELMLSPSSPAKDIITDIYDRAYPLSASRHRRFLLVVNPQGGNGRAMKEVEKKCIPLMEAAGCSVDVKSTEHPGHAQALARELDVDLYDVIACASGDGIPFEVFNGLYQRRDRAAALNGLAVSQIPCGSGNAMSESCHGTKNITEATLSLIKSPIVNIDLMAVTQSGDTKVSFLSQTCGIIANADPQTEYLRFLGPFRFDIGVAYGVLGSHKFPCDLAIKYMAKSKDAVRKHFTKHLALEDAPMETTITEENLTLRYDPGLSVPEDWEWVPEDFTAHMSFFYAGNMPMITHNVTFFPSTLPNDGCFDIVMMDSRTPLSRQVPILLSSDSGKHVFAPETQHSKVLAYRLIPKPGVEGLYAIDGERYTSSEVQVEVLPSAGKTLIKGGKYVATGF